MSGRLMHNIGIAATIGLGSAATIKYLCDHNDKELRQRGEWKHVREVKRSEFRGKAN